MSRSRAPDQPRVDAVDSILRDWLAEPELLLLCGRWGDGALMELVPRKPPRLTAGRYEGRFAGLRDLLLDGESHHVHLDLGRVSRVTYMVSPSVCFGFRPSFEVRLHGARAVQRFALGLSIRRPYRRGALEREAVCRYFERWRVHRERYPRVVSLAVVDAKEGAPRCAPFDWGELAAIAAGSAHAAAGCASARDLERLLEAR